MDFKAGEVLLIHKPLSWTSFAVVNKLRYHLRKKTGEKNIKVGHAGTLDPLADGLLIICTGKKTKDIDSFMGLEKVYTGTITLGACTPSYDLETEICETFDISGISVEMIHAAAKTMTGEMDQQPPIFSAKKVDGKRAYDLARKGKEVTLQPKRIHIRTFEITAVDMPLVHFRITCSKGTYIRSVAHDFGKLLNSGGHLSALRREAIGEFNLGDALTIPQMLAVIEGSDPDKIPTI
jgi:tRNA pseudouridine55 synthase